MTNKKFFNWPLLSLYIAMVGVCIAAWTGAILLVKKVMAQEPVQNFRVQEHEFGWEFFATVDGKDYHQWPLSVDIHKATWGDESWMICWDGEKTTTFPTNDLVSLSKCMSRI